MINVMRESNLALLSQASYKWISHATYIYIHNNTSFENPGMNMAELKYVVYKVKLKLNLPLDCASW